MLRIFKQKDCPNILDLSVFEAFLLRSLVCQITLL